MDKILTKNNIIKKITVYTSAAIIFTATPALSVLAVEESAQTTASPSENTFADIPAVEAPSVPPSEIPDSGESQPAPGTTPAETPDSNPFDINNVPTQTTPTLPLPTDTTTVLPQTPDTIPAPSVQPSQPPAPADQNNVAVTPMQGTVYAASQKGLNVRSGPSTGHSKIGTLKYGQAITVTGKTADNWYQIQYSGSVGYVLAEYVSDTPLADTENPVYGNSPSENPVAQNSDSQIPDNEAAPDEFAGEEAGDTDLQTEDESFPEETPEITSSLLGTPVVIVLAIAIAGVLVLIGYSVYSLFKKDNIVDDPYYDDEFYGEDPYPDDEYCENTQYSDDVYYEDTQYSDDEYYEDAQYSNDEYYEDTQYPDDEYCEDTPYSDDEYYEDAQYPDDEYYEENDKKH